MKFWKRRFATLLAVLMIAGSAMSFQPVSAAEPTATYSGVAITNHEGGYDYGFMTRKLVKHGYDFSLDRINYYATDAAISMSNRANAEIVNGALTTKEGKDFVFGWDVGMRVRFKKVALTYTATIGIEKMETAHSVGIAYGF